MKFRTAANICTGLGITLEQSVVNVDEIQAADGETVARRKAAEAYQLIKQPLLISDDSWIIPGLGGFPGPYMKYMNQWFSSEDWLRLVQTLSDRRIILRQIVAYQSADEQKLFYTDVEGALLNEIKGASDFTHNTVASFDNGQHSIAEVMASTGSALAASQKESSWHAFASWYIQQHD